MIVKHIPIKFLQKSNFASLVDYICSEQGKQERLGQITISNCQSLDVNWAVQEVLATQSQNQRANGDKTYHLLVSFPAGDTASSALLQEIEAKLCASIGYAEHQRISAVHYDTDNMHIHIAINKIHPKRHTMHEPFRAYKTLGDVAAKLELEHGLERSNHQPKKRISENRAHDMEQHTGLESLLSWIRRECLEHLKHAENWSQVHQVMQNYGLELRERSNGLVIVDGHGVAVKASTVARYLSKVELEKRYGAFEKRAVSFSPGDSSSKAFHIKKPGIGKLGQKPPRNKMGHLSHLSQLDSMSIDNGKHYTLKPAYMKQKTDELFARYQKERQDKALSLTAALTTARNRKNRLIDQAKRSSRLKRAAIKLLQGKDVSKKALYAFVSKTLQKELAKASSEYLKEREGIYQNYEIPTWADWLKLKALAGEREALNALRSREARQKLQGNTITANSQQRASLREPRQPDNITKTGIIIHRLGDCTVRDDGEVLKISRSSSEQGLKAALEMAIERFGSRLSVKGSDEFKEQIAQVAATLKQPLSFDDPTLEQRRQELVKTTLLKEENHAPARNSKFECRRTNSRSHENLGRERSPGAASPQRTAKRAADAGTIINKPNLGSPGAKPPPTNQNSLRNLPQLDMVQLTSRAEMLLPSDVSGDLEYQRTQPDNNLRRGLSRPGLISKGDAARDKYIAERELKRQRITDIPLHRAYCQDDEGSLQFAGLRQIDGETLALLKRQEEIIVLPIDVPTSRRMQKLTIGDPIKLDAKGKFLTRGRSR